MEHTPECEQAQKQREAEIELWEANWPNACKECGGLGGSSHVERVGPYLQDCWDDCGECVGDGKCPRCGTELFADAGKNWNKIFGDWIDSMKPCPICGWNWGQNAGDVRPDDFECWCWLPDSDDEYKEEHNG